MDEYLKRSIVRRMMDYVHTFHKYFKNRPTSKYKKGVFADINENFTHCDNTGMIQYDYPNSCVSNGYIRYKFKGFEWTEETLMIEIEKLYKINFIKIKLKIWKRIFNDQFKNVYKTHLHKERNFQYILKSKT